MTGKRSNFKQIDALKRVLALASEGMDVLDAHQFSPEAAVHLDLCRQCLERDLRQLTESHGD